MQQKKGRFVAGPLFLQLTLLLLPLLCWRSRPRWPLIAGSAAVHTCNT